MNLGELFLNRRGFDFDDLNFPRPRDVSDHHSEKLALRVRVPDEDYKSSLFAEAMKRARQLFGTALNARERAKISVD